MNEWKLRRDAVDLVLVAQEAANLVLGREGCLGWEERARRLKLDEERWEWEGLNEEEHKEMMRKKRAEERAYSESVEVGRD